MNKMQLLAIAIGLAFLASIVPAPVQAAPTAQKTIAIEFYSVDTSADYENFATKCKDWGFAVKRIYNGNSTYDLTGVDIVVLPMMNENLTTANLAAIVAWWNLGNKAMWVAGDSDYAGMGGFGAMASHRPNNVMTAIGAHMYVEQTSVESQWNDITVGSVGYRVAGGEYASTGDAATLTANLASNKTVFHGPASVIAKNATHYVDFGAAGVPTTVNWVVKAMNTSQYWSHTKNATTQVGPYRLATHGYLAKCSPTLMGLETFTNGNKLVVTGENLFSMYKYMFSVPTEKDNKKFGSSMTLVYNTIMFFAGMTQDRVAPVASDLDITIMNSTMGLCLFEWKVSDGGANPSGVVGCKININSTLKFIQQRTNLVEAKMTANVNVTAGVTQAILDNTDVEIIPIDFAGNVGTFDDGTVTTTPVKPSPSFEVPLVLLAVCAVVIISRRKN